MTNSDSSTGSRRCTDRNRGKRYEKHQKESAAVGGKAESRSREHVELSRGLLSRRSGSGREQRGGSGERPSEEKEKGRSADRSSGRDPRAQSGETLHRWVRNRNCRKYWCRRISCTASRRSCIAGRGEEQAGAGEMVRLPHPI